MGRIRANPDQECIPNNVAYSDQPKRGGGQRTTCSEPALQTKDLAQLVAIPEPEPPGVKAEQQVVDSFGHRATRHHAPFRSSFFALADATAAASRSASADTVYRPNEVNR